MKLQDKLARIEQELRNIAGHVDADAAVRNAALDRVVALVGKARDDIQAEIKAQVDDLQ